ncbi:MAG: histidine kinase [Cytophagaceae bacterium]|jgi:signal transduction histidine kinase|nr:histidine kinase [Cytophagaceae bacterium]
MTIKFKLFTGILILISIFAVDFFVNQRLSKDVIKNTAYLNNSEAIIRNSNILNKLMIDMQSGLRGYLLTDQEDFLVPYYEGLKSVPSLLKEQKKLVNSSNQKERLDSIHTLHLKWIDYSNALITTKKDTLPEANARYIELFERRVKARYGKRLNDSIRDIFQDFDSYEYRRRQDRRRTLEKSIEDTRFITFILAICSITVALVSGLYIIRLITTRISKMVDLAEEISKGNFKTMKDNQHDELRKLSESLNTMSTILDKNFKELTKKNKELDEFAYVVSHDLKAPLRGIDNITKWLEEDHEQELTPDVKRNLDLIKGRTKRLENMINGLLDYARIGKVKRGFQKVAVEKMLNELVELLVPPNFVVNIKNKMPVLMTDKLHIEQVFSNLISNAVKYNDKPVGRIDIGAFDWGDYYEFTVQDNGIGIQSAYYEKIFTIFQTLQERDAFESTGVGLAIVKKILEDHKSTITVESISGKGTVFTFTWPKYLVNE